MHAFSMCLYVFMCLYVTRAIIMIFIKGNLLTYVYFQKAP